MSDHTPLNPLLQSFLPQMIERLADAERRVRDILRPVSVDMQSVSDFLDYEISRAQLELDRAEWASRSTEAEAIDQRGRHLRQMLNGIEYDIADTVGERLERMTDILRKLREEGD